VHRRTASGFAAEIDLRVAQSNPQLAYITLSLDLDHSSTTSPPSLLHLLTPHGDFFSIPLETIGAHHLMAEVESDSAVFSALSDPQTILAVR
jgi:hypothetical protein